MSAPAISSLVRFALVREACAPAGTASAEAPPDSRTTSVVGRERRGYVQRPTASRGCRHLRRMPAQMDFNGGGSPAPADRRGGQLHAAGGVSMNAAATGAASMAMTRSGCDGEADDIGAVATRRAHGRRWPT
jgi:hypothetical protein